MSIVKRGSSTLTRRGFMRGLLGAGAAVAVGGLVVARSAVDKHAQILASVARVRRALWKTIEVDNLEMRAWGRYRR